jgi:hypothetical protein
MGTIIVPTSIWSNQHVKFITSTSLNLVKQIIKHVEPMSMPHVLFYIPIKLILVQLVKITTPLDTFQQHLPEMFFQPKVGEMEIHKTPTRINVQNLRITRWTIIEEEQLINC